MVVKKSKAQCKNSKCQKTKHSKAKCSKAECEVIVCLNISSIRYFIEKLEITYPANFFANKVHPPKIDTLVGSFQYNISFISQYQHIF